MAAADGARGDGAGAAPDERGWIAVPGAGGRFEGADDFLGVLGVLPVQRAMLEDALGRPAMFSQLPPKGVYSGMMPRLNSQQSSTRERVPEEVGPIRLSKIRSMRRGGDAAGKATWAVGPTRHASHLARAACGSGGVAGSGKVARIAPRATRSFIFSVSVE